MFNNHPNQEDNSVKNKRRFYSDASIDARGFQVFDRNLNPVGTVSDIYCDRFDLQPRYIEITPLDEHSEQLFLYPVECATWKNRGPVFLQSTKKSLETYETYDANNLLLKEGDQLITYNESLDAGCVLFHYRKLKYA